MYFFHVQVKARLVPKHEAYLRAGYTLLFAMLVDVILSNLYRKLSNTYTCICHILEIS